MLFFHFFFAIGFPADAIVVVVVAAAAHLVVDGGRNQKGSRRFFFDLFFLEMNHCLPRQGPPSLRCTHRVDIIDDIVEVGTGDYLFFSALFANFASSVSLVDGSFFLLKQKKNFFLDRQWNPACENVPERFRRFFDLI